MCSLSHPINGIPKRKHASNTLPMETLVFPNSILCITLRLPFILSPNSVCVIPRSFLASLINLPKYATVLFVALESTVANSNTLRPL